MQSVQNLVQKNLFSLLLLVTAGGFAMLLVELILMGHTSGSQLVAVAASAVGMGLALAGIIAKGSFRYLLVILFLILSASGLYGTLEHTEGREHRAQEVQGLTITVTGGDEEGEKTEAEHNSKPAADEEGEDIGEELVDEFTQFPPLLSPLGL
ncbi:MAG: hypothetical protein KDE56_09110, partial [Anaerolineales bacterium]|nr:hypothetical protein [Anaerolineales bacterium]